MFSGLPNLASSCPKNWNLYLLLDVDLDACAFTSLSYISSLVNESETIGKITPAASSAVSVVLNPNLFNSNPSGDASDG